MFNLCTDFVNPNLKSIYYAIQNQLKVGNYRHFQSGATSRKKKSHPITDDYKLVKKSVESLIVLWHDAHENDRYKKYYKSVLIPNYFIFPSDYGSIVSMLKEIDFTELLELISPLTVRESLSRRERKKLDDMESDKKECV